MLIGYWSSGANSPNIQWERAYGGNGQEYTTNSSTGSSIFTTLDSGYIVIGSANTGPNGSADGDVINGAGGLDLWVLKINKYGAIVWTKRYGSTATEWLQNSIRTLDGGYAIVATTNGSDGNILSNHGQMDIWVVKLDANGVLEWESCYGSSGSEHGFDILQANDGGYLVLGQSGPVLDGDVTHNHGNGDFWLLKLSGMGQLQWQKVYGGSNLENPRKIINGYNGGYLLGGYSHSNNGQVSGNHGGQDTWLVKISDTGSIEWQKSYSCKKPL